VAGTLPTTAQSYSVTVGSGGATGGYPNGGINGASSVFGSVTALGGNGGTSQTRASTSNPAVYSLWGSGGGGGYDGAAGQPAAAGNGYAGGRGGNNGIYYNGGGGGGAGGPGGDSVQGSRGGNGGSGISSSITGSALYYGGGGGGGIYTNGAQLETQGTGGLGGGGNGNVFSPAAVATAGLPNTGGGGGGGGQVAGQGQNTNGGAGGSGIVVISYVSGPAPGSYAAWAASNSVNGGVSGDSNRDGLQNGIAYFMGVSGPATNPGLSASNTVTWPMSAAFSGTFAVQTSPDLGTWTNVTPQPTRNGNGNLVYTLLPGAGKLFVRLVVTPN